jgi:predicted transcriptional regulator
MKTAISIPDELFADADRAASRLHVSRSELYRRALHAYLQQMPAASVTAQLDAFYAEHPELGGLAPGWEAAQAEVLGRDPW